MQHQFAKTAGHRICDLVQIDLSPQPKPLQFLNGIVSIFYNKIINNNMFMRHACALWNSYGGISQKQNTNCGVRCAVSAVTD